MHGPFVPDVVHSIKMAESSSTTPPEQVASVTTIRRITRELSEIQSTPSSHWTIQVIGDNILEYHFTIRGPPGTEFEGGLYHGRLLLPFNYPFAPPSILLLNPSGRFEVNKKICLSMSNYHPELWQPAWGIRTIMEALRSFFPTPGDGAIGAIDWPPEMRKKLAVESLEWTCNICAKRNDEILTFFQEHPETAAVPPLVVETLSAEVAVNSPRDVVDAGLIAPPLVHASEPVRVERQPNEAIRVEAPEVLPPHAESNQELLLNLGIYSIIFILIALIVDILLHPPAG